MNKFKFWEIELLWQKYFFENKINKIDTKGETLKNLKLIKKYFLKNYSKDISKFNKNFFLVDRFSFEKSIKKIFSGEDRTRENNKTKSLDFFGLKKQQLFFHENKPIYLIDNHNKALFPFLEISEILEQKINIIHIDAHRDDANFSKQILKKIDWKNINWCMKNSRVSDYLNLAQKGKLVGKILNITQEKEFINLLNNFDKDIIKKNKKFILNLDIDIFGPEGDYVDLKLKIETIAKVWKNSVAVIIATSPSFILQEDAKKIIEIMTK